MDATRDRDPEPLRLNRLFRPRTIAVVGASERQQRAREVIKGLQEADVELFLVNPNRPEVFGMAAYPTLAAVGKPIDAVFVTVNSSAAIDAVAAAADADVGGLVINAGGFGESAEGGSERQRRLLRAANGTPILGPNCNGFIDVKRALRISGAPHLPIRAGGIAFVTHSGALFASMGAAGYARQIGFSYLISTGNEAMIDMADCIEFLVGDPDTKAISLAIETIRRPKAFFTAVERAHAAGKPVLAIKLGRGELAQAIANSHTGAIAGETWIYDAAFRQHGIELAYDLTELADRAICFDQLPSTRWSALDGLAILTASGGGAEMASDYCARLNIPLPALDDVKTEIQAIVPGTSVVNPLDMTGFVLGDAEQARRLVEVCANSREVDTLLVQWFLHDEGVEHGSAILNALDAITSCTDKTLMLGSLEDCAPGTWATALAKKQVAITHGLPSTLRALQSMGAFVRRGRRSQEDRQPIQGPRIQPPADQALRASSVGRMVRFAEAMRLLSDVGFETAPFRIVEEIDDLTHLTVAFEGPYAVKLADVPHRSELGAVRLNVTSTGLTAAVTAMRDIAAAQQLPGSVVIQKQLRLTGEAFVGIKADENFGPVVICGLGGILVELMQRMIGAITPLSRSDIDWMLDALASLGVFRGIRGAEPWDRRRLGAVIASANALATGSADWLGALDINPLGIVERRPVVLDALMTVRRPDPTHRKPHVPR